MEHVDIAALRPTLDALESKQIKAVVTLIWPYSSSQRQFALLLAEPDLRLRRKKGQVRARFSSTSARALATTGVGIGDEVVLSLHGAQFVQHGAVGTPGKSLDWELAYTQTVAVSVRRNGAEMANLELIDAVPTPAPRSPVKKQAAAPSPIPQWSSPAFLKRARLSDGPFFEQPAYDPLADESYEGHDKKRRRKSYRDWKAWTYTARTPSPEKEDTRTEDELDEVPSSPSRPPQLPKTPVSPSRTEPTSAAVEALEDSEYIEETTIADSAQGDTTIDDGELQKVHVPLSMSPGRQKRDTVRDGDYYNSYPPPLDSQYDFGGDTELNTEDEDEDEDATVPDVEVVDASATEIATELEDEQEETNGKPLTVAPQIVAEPLEVEDDDTASATEEESVFEAAKPDQPKEALVDVEDTTVDEVVPEVAEPAIIVDESLAVAMPPPSLPVLHTDFAPPTAADSLAPIGTEPSSPDLKAVDSATLPLPSPFPGEQAASYFDHVSAGQQVPLDGPVAQEEPEAESDAEYIMESSFFSSISSSRAGGLHQDHETAFAPLRFTFGMDGAGWSRPLELSSPPPEDTLADAAGDKDDSNAGPDHDLAQLEVVNESVVSERPQNTEGVNRSSLAETSEEDVAKALTTLNDTAKHVTDIALPPAQANPAEVIGVDPVQKPTSVVNLSSDVESDQSEDEDAVKAELEEEQSSEEETEPESEDEVESESDEEHETEPEGEEMDVQQVLPPSGQVRIEPDTTINTELEAEDERRQPHEDVPVSTQASASVSGVVDLGSPSADESSDKEDNSKVVKPKPVQTDDGVGDVNSSKHVGDTNTSQLKNYDPGAGLKEQPVAATIPGSFDDFIAMDVVQEPATVVSSSLDRSIREPASFAIPDTHEEPPSLGFDDWEPQLGMDESLPFIGNEDNFTSKIDTEHPDVKMESVEDIETQDVPQESRTDPATEVRIGVPENVHKLGEPQFKSVPATAPARNTRSKAKSAASPPEEDPYVSRLSTSMRRTRSKASSDSTNRNTTSPTQARAPPRSTATPTRDATQTSPYSLRSQSKNLSPEKAIASSQTAPVHRSPRKLVRRDTDFDIVPSQVENRDVIGSMFEPSQELGFGYSQLSQGRYSDVGFVKDSEEDTTHSEGSITTVQYSDDDQAHTNMSVEAADEEPATPRLKPPPASLSQTRRQTRSRSRSTGQQSTIVSPSQPPQSPRRSPRLTRSTFSASPSPRITRTTREPAQASSPMPVAADEQQEDEATPTVKEQSAIYPVLPIEGEGDLGSSPPAPSIASITSRRSPLATAPALAQQPILHESNLLTPEDTQQTAMEPPLSFQARQPDQSLPITPELTQTTSTNATLRSFDIPVPGVQTQPAPHTPTLPTSPRRKSAIAKLRSSSPVAASSPTHQSSSAISADEDATLTKKADLPSIGLSTPLAYYTPLRDLIYFLNRSSQFHSSSNPDVLALCTSASTAPAQAPKGPRHWTTTLHITDLSVWPHVTSVTVFRAYQNALPVCDKGDVILLRAFAVQSRNRLPRLVSRDESAWCVWRYGVPLWGAKKGQFAELRAREEVRGPSVERGEGEWKEVGRLRGWWVGGGGEGLDERGRESEGEREREREPRGSQSTSPAPEKHGSQREIEHVEQVEGDE